MHVKSDLILKILNRHSRFYRYDAHDTIVLNHIHFRFIIGGAPEVLKNKIIKKKKSRNVVIPM